MPRPINLRISCQQREIDGNANRLIQVTQDLNPSFSSPWSER